MSRWDEKKNKALKSKRGAGFDDLILNGVLLDVLPNPNRADQEIWVFEYLGYAWALVHDPEVVRHVTLWPSRKLKREYLK